MSVSSPVEMEAGLLLPFDQGGLKPAGGSVIWYKVIVQQSISLIESHHVQ